MRVPIQPQFLQSLMRSKSSTAADDGMFEKRRWMSFLTWAFVLAEMVGRDAFLPASAHAADGDQANADHAGSDTAPIANNLPNIDVSTATESPDPITYQHAAPMPAYAADATPSELASAKAIPVADLGPDQHFSDYGGGGGGTAASESGEAGSSGDQLSHALDQPLVVALGHDGSLIDLGLHLDLGDAAHNLLGAPSNTLGSLPLVGDTLEGLGDALANTTGNLLSSLQPAVSLIGIGSGDSHHYGSNLGLPGQLQFSSLSDASGPSELVSPFGNYTTYGISLSIGSAHDGSTAGQASVHSDASEPLALDIHTGDDLPGSGFHGSDALHLDQTILRTAADVLA